MKEANLLLKCWVQQEKIFIDNLLISRKRPTIVSVHDLRVAIKKLRSFLRLKKKLNGDEWKGSFSSVSALFKSFGRAGDLDMSLALLRKLELKKNLSFPFFKEKLSLNRSLRRKLANQDAIRFKVEDLNAFDQQFNLDLSDKEICEEIIQHSILKIQKVKELVKHFQKNAHEIRKQLKDVHYWVKISPEYFDKKFISIEALDQMLKFLGARQDLFVFRKKIEQYIKDLPENKERSNLKTLGKKLKTVQDELLEKARDKWKDVMPVNVT
jgi:CHAD domain-containing protein